MSHDSFVAWCRPSRPLTPVPVVASYGMTSGFTPPEGITAGMVYYDRSRPPAAADARASALCVFNFVLVLFSYSVVNLNLSNFHRFF